MFQTFWPWDCHPQKRQGKTQPRLHSGLLTANGKSRCDAIAARQVSRKERDMHETHQDNPLTLGQCWQCQAAMHEHDRFCRHCGANLGERAALFACADLRSRQTTRELNNVPSPYATSPLAQVDCSRPISGPLIKLVTTELTMFNGNRFARRLTLVLISFPIWLMMVLLSPLDAYAATKAIARQL